MSFILDALKKSEAERQQQTGAEFSSVPSSPDDSPSLKWLWILGALLAVNVVVLLGILLRPNGESAPAADPDSPAVASEPADAAAAGEPSFEEQVAEARERQADRELTDTSAPAAMDSQTQAQPAATIAPPPATVRTQPARRVMTIDELRISGSMQIPELHLDIHVYSETPEDRFVFINMVKHREQSRLDEGPVVSEITPEGVILDYRGTSFLLPRE